MKKAEFKNHEAGEIVRLLERMQEGYTKRAVDEIEEYARDLFVQGDDMIILGTSDGEWCLGYENAKELLLGDWEHWGNVVIDTDNVDVVVKGDIAWFYTEGSVEYRFKSDDETCDRYLNFVKEDLQAESWLGPMSDESKLTTIAFTLAHFMLENENIVRQYQWEIRLSGIAIKKQEGWRFTQLQFSLPTTSKYPDERMWQGNVYEKAHKRDLEKLRDLAEGKVDEDQGFRREMEIKNILDGFNQDYLKNEIVVEALIEKYFSKEPMVRIIGTGTDHYIGFDELVKAVEIHRQQWEGISLATNEAIINVVGNTAWVLGMGETKKLIPYKEAIKREMEEANRIIESELTSREKLFKIRRNIATMFQETSRGEMFVWPIRFDAVLIQQEGKWLFHRLQFSYPFNMILEGKTDASRIKEV